MRSSARMETSTCTPPVRQNSLPSQPQTLAIMQLVPTQQTGYYILQQNSFDQQSFQLSNPHGFSQPKTSSGNLQPNQTAQIRNGGSPSQLPYITSASGSHPPTNIVQYASMQHQQVGTLTLNQDPQVINTTVHSMQNDSCTDPHFSVRSVPSNTNNVSENSYCIYGINGVQTRHQPATKSQQVVLTAQMSHASPTINMNQGQVNGVGQHNEAPCSVAHFHTASEVPVGSLPHSQFITSSSQMIQRPCKKHAGYIQLKHSSRQTPPLLYRAGLNSASQNQSTQRPNQLSSSLTQNQIQSQTTPISGKTNLATVTASHSSMQSDNTMSMSGTNSQNTSTSTSQTSHSVKYSRSHLLRLLVQENISQLPDCITPGKNYTQGKVRQGKGFQEPAKETSISRPGEIGMLNPESQSPQKSSKNQMTVCKKKIKEVPYFTNSAVSSNLLSPPRMARQVNKAVAVVPPISQQVSSYGQKNDVTTETHDRLPLKYTTDKNLLEECKHIGNGANLGASPRLGSATDASVDISKIQESESDPTSGFQSNDISQCQNGPVSTIGISNKEQDAFQVVDVTSKSSARQNDGHEVESSLEGTAFDLSTIPVVKYTLKELRDLVDSLKDAPTERDVLMITDVVKFIVDLFYDGDKQKLVTYLKQQNFKLIKLAASKYLFENIEFCVNKTNTVVLTCLESKHLKTLENCSQILTNETTFPSEDFRSSWLNVDGQPADVDSVLAEPISDYDLTWCKNSSPSVYKMDTVDSLTQIGTDYADELGVHACKGIPKTTAHKSPKDICHSEPEHSSVIPAKTDCKRDMMVPEKGCVSGTPNKLSRTQRKSKKKFNKQLQEEENKQAFVEPSLTITSDKCVTNNTDMLCNNEKMGTFDDADFSNDLAEIELLSAEDARKIFSECDLKQEPHQRCEGERKDLVTICVKNNSDSSNVKPVDHLKFTCPHVTGLGCGRDDFCPSCLNQTPLLYVEQDDTQDEELKTDYQTQSHSQRPEKAAEYQNALLCLESSSITISTPKSDTFDVVRNPDPSDQTQSSSTPARELHHGIASTENNSITKPVPEHLQKITPSTGTNTKHPTNLDAEMVSPKRLTCENIKFPVTDAVHKADDFSLSSDDTTHKQHSSVHRSVSRDDGQDRDECKESGNVGFKKTSLDQFLKIKIRTPSQTPANGTAKCKKAVNHKRKRPRTKDNRHDGQSKESKKLRLELYGSNKSNPSGHNKEETPIYLKISPISNSGQRYTDEPSAKQKVYSHWSTTLIRPNRSSPSYKHLKDTEDQLKSRMHALKRVLEDRIMTIQQKISTKKVKDDDENSGP